MCFVEMLDCEFYVMTCMHFFSSSVEHKGRYFQECWDTGPIDFSQNTFFYVPQKKEGHTVL